MNQTPWIWHNLIYPSSSSLPLFMAILPYLATSLPLSGPQVHFIAHPWPYIYYSCTTSYYPPTLFSICNLSHFISHATYLCGWDLSKSHPNSDRALTRLKFSFLTPLFFCQSLREKPNFHCHFFVAIHYAVFRTCSFILYAVHIPLHVLILPFFLNATKHGHYRCRRRNFPWY